MSYETLNALADIAEGYARGWGRDLRNEMESFLGTGRREEFVTTFISRKFSGDYGGLLFRSKKALECCSSLGNGQHANTTENGKFDTDAAVRTAFLTIILYSEKAERVVHTIQEVGALNLEDMTAAAAFQRDYIPFTCHPQESLEVIDAIACILSEIAADEDEKPGVTQSATASAIDDHYKKNRAVLCKAKSTGLTSRFHGNVGLKSTSTSRRSKTGGETNKQAQNPGSEPGVPRARPPPHGPFSPTLTKRAPKATTSPSGRRSAVSVLRGASAVVGGVPRPSAGPLAGWSPDDTCSPGSSVEAATTVFSSFLVIVGATLATAPPNAKEKPPAFSAWPAAAVAGCPREPFDKLRHLEALVLLLLLLALLGGELVPHREDVRQR
eukprot:g7088.t1